MLQEFSTVLLGFVSIKRRRTLVERSKQALVRRAIKEWFEPAKHVVIAELYTDCVYRSPAGRATGRRVPAFLASVTAAFSMDSGRWRSVG